MMPTTTLASIAPVFLDWADLISQLGPILLVVGIGILTVLKRLFERFVLRRDPAAPTPDDDGEPTKPPTMAEEIKRYVDMIEGRDATATAPREDEASTREPAPSTTTQPKTSATPSRSKSILQRTNRGRDRRSIESGNLEEMTLEPLAPGTAPLVTPRGRPLIGSRDDYSISHDELRFDAKALEASIRVSHADLRAGSGPAERRDTGLARVRLSSSKRAIREAMLWREILSPPLALRPPSDGS